MSANNTSGKASASMTEHFSLRHKVIAIAMSVVMLGFGWPAVSPASSFAENGGGQADAAAVSEDQGEGATGDASGENADLQDEGSNDVESYSLNGLGTYTSQINVASESENAEETIAAKIVKLNAAGEQIGTEDIKIPAGTAADLASKYCPKGFELSYVGNRPNVKAGDSVIYSVGKTTDGKTFVKTSADQLGGVILADGVTIDFYYTQTVTSYNISTKVTIDGKDVSSDASKYVNIVAPSTVKQGATGTMTATAVDGYTVDSVSISNGTVSEKDGAYTISGVAADATVTVAMKAHDPYTITFQGSNTHFTYSPTGYDKVDADSYKGSSHTIKYSSKYGVPSESVSFSIKGINEWDTTSKALNILTLTIGETTYPVNLPSTASKGSSAETTIGSYKVTVSYDGSSRSGSNTYPTHTVTITNVNGGTVAGDISVYVNHKNATTYEVWAKELTGVKDEKAYVQASKTSKTLSMKSDDFNGNYAERNSNSLATTVYFNVADGYKTDASTIKVQLVNNGVLGETLTATKLNSPVSKEGTAYNYSFTIPSSNKSTDLRFIVQCQPDENNVWAVYKNGDTQVGEANVSNANSFKVAEGVADPTQEGKHFINWANGAATYYSGDVIRVSSAEQTFNKEKGRYEIVFQANFSDVPSEKSYPYTVEVYLESADKSEAQKINTVPAFGPEGTAYIDADDIKAQLVDEKYFPALLDVDYENSALTGAVTKDGKLVLKVSYKYKTVTGQVSSYNGVYDGASHGASVTVDPIAGCEIDASSNASVKDVKDGTVTAKCDSLKVTYNGTDVTDLLYKDIKDGELKVSPKPATITAGSAEKEYDGNPLTTDQFTTGGFVEGQGIASATIEGSQTVVGSSPSTVKDGSWTAKEGTSLDNYTVTTQPGTLTVKSRSAKYQIEVEANSADHKYDGTEKSVSGLKATTFTVDGNEYTVSGLTASGAKGTDAGTYTNAVSGTAVVEDKAGNDVSSQFAVSVKNGSLKIDKREVTITSKDAEKVYNGQPLTKHEVEVADDGIADSDKDGVTYVFTGAQTEAGESENRFTVSGLSDTNYKVTTKYGTLKVSPVTDKVTVTITEHGGSHLYDGTEKTATGYDVKSSNKLYTDKCFSFSGDASVKGTDAGTYEMQLKAADFKNTSDNFSNVEFNIVDAKLTIAKRSVKLTSGTDSKVYDATPLTNGTVTVSGDGFADGEGATYSVTGTITDAGHVDNEFTYALNKGTNPDNYSIETQNGTLTVTPVTEKVVVTVAGHKGGEKYSGEEQTVSGYDISADNTLYSVGTAVEFSGSASVSGTDAGTYAMGLKDADFKNTDGNFSNVRFVVTDGELAISQRGVTLTSADDSKAYDGTPLTNGTVTVSGDGFVDGEGATYSVTGSQTLVGSSENEFTYALNDGTKTKNYSIETENGTLTVADRADADKYVVKVVANSEKATYDGNEHSATGMTGTAYTNDKGVAFTVTGLSADDAVATDAGEYGHSITGTAKVVDPDGNDVTAQFKVSTEDGKLVINRKPATITAGSAEKEYDGNPLTTDQFTTGGFVEGQGIASATIEGSQTVVGSSPSTVKDGSWTAKEGTSLDNYTVTTQPGTLTVKSRSAKYQIEVEANSADHKYDGTEKSVSGLKATTFTVDGNEYTVSGLTASGAKGTDAGTYTNAVSGTAVVEDKAGNDVSSQFAVSVKNGSLKIDKREVTITSKDAEKVYNGQPLTKHEVEVADDGIADSDKDGVTYVFTGAQTEAGESENRFTVSGLSDTNYKVTTKYGTLKVSPVTDKVTVTITEHGGSHLYDGTEKTATGYDVKSSNKLYTDKCFSFSGDASVKGTDAGTYEMQLKAADFKNTSDNFSNVEFNIVDAKLTIAKRSVKLTSGTDSKVYDATPLTNGTVTVSGDGFADGEGATYSVTGTITDAGHVDNEFTYALNKGTNPDNYSIETQNGTLTVTPVTEKVVVTVAGHKGGEKYSGEEQTVSGYDISADNTLYSVGTAVEFSGSASVSGTDAGTYAMGLKDADFKNTDGNFSNVRFVVTDGELAISQRGVTLTSADDSKAYDGTPLTNGTVTVSGDGFVDGEGATYSVTGSQTLVGSSENEFTYALNDGTKTKNYSIETENGTLTVADRADADKYVVKVVANSEKATYDGNEHSATGMTGTAYTNDKGVAFTVTGLSADDAVATDAGEYGHSITGTAKVVDPDGNDVTAQFKVSTEDGKLVIGKRNATVNTKDAWKYYDGKPLTAGGSIELVGDESATVVTSKSQTNVGVISNDAYTIDWNGTAKSDNYNVVDGEFGTLTVLAQSINPEDPDAYMGVEIGTLPDVVYNGYAQEQKPTVTDKDDNALEEGTDYTVSFSDDVKNVGMVTVTITGIGNYTGTVTRTYQITPAPLHITTGSATKVYNGEPLTNSEMTVTGLVGDDTLTGLTTGSQTEVGSSPNTYELKGGTADLANYTVTEELGSLTVTEAPAPEADTPADDNKSVMAKTGDTIPMAAVVAVAAVAMIALAGAVVAARRRKN